MEYIQSKMRKYITYRTFFDAKYNFVYYSKIYLHRCNLLVVTGNVTKKFGTWNRNQGKTERFHNTATIKKCVTTLKKSHDQYLRDAAAQICPARSVHTVRSPHFLAVSSCWDQLSRRDFYEPPS